MTYRRTLTLFVPLAALLLLGTFSPTSAYATVTIPSQLTLDPASDSGIASNDAITNATTVTINGIGGPGTRIHLKIDTIGQLPVYLVAADGTWSATLASLSSRIHSIEALAEEGFPVGNFSGVSSPITVTIDTTAPQVTSFSYSPATTTDQAVEARVFASSEPVYELESADPLAPHVFTENGDYVFHFRDAAGNEGTATATVNWIDHQLPVITLAGDASMSITQGTAFTDPGAIATDHLGATTTVSVSGSVDTATIGTYILTYDATDAEGKHATSVSRSVSVLTPVARSSGGGGGRSHSSRSGGSAPMAEPAPEATSTPAIAGEVLGASTYRFTRDLTTGMTGEDVRMLQELLAAAGYFHETPTAYFGPVTEAAVKRYQAERSIDATGYVGQLTRSVLNAGTAPALSDEAKARLLADLYAQLAALLAKR